MGWSMSRVFLYGAFQDGTRRSEVCTDVNFGDRLIYQVTKDALVKEGYDVDFCLPDDNDIMASLTPDDVLVIGPGGLFHPMLINLDSILSCKAEKAVFGVGVNWPFGTKGDCVNEVRRVAQSLCSRMEVISVRDRITLNFVGAGSFPVFPDVSLVYMGTQSTGIGSAFVWSGDGEPEDNEDLLFFSLLSKRRDECYGPTRHKRTIITDINQMSGYKRVRGESYHAMLVPLCFGADVLTRIVNIKQLAFIEDYRDYLVVNYCGDSVHISLPPGGYPLRMMACEGLSRLVQWVKSVSPVPAKEKSCQPPSSSESATK